MGDAFKDEFKEAQVAMGHSSWLKEKKRRTPMPPAILKPFPNPIFDSEILLPGDSHMYFFRNSQGQPFKNAIFERVAEDDARSCKKTHCDTSLMLSGQLAQPLEFSFFSYSLLLPEEISAADRGAILDTGLLTFMFTGNRKYWSVPLSLVPPRLVKDLRHTVPANSKMPADLKEFTEQEFTEQDKKDEHAAPAYAGNAQLRIRSADNFCVLLGWPKPLEIAKPIYARMVMNGILWTPM